MAIGQAVVGSGPEQDDRTLPPKPHCVECVGTAVCPIHTRKSAQVPKRGVAQCTLPWSSDITRDTK